MATAFLAVAAGAVAAPLNPTYRGEEFEFYLTDLSAKALIVEAGASGPASRGGAKTRRAHRSAASGRRSWSGRVRACGGERRQDRRRARSGRRGRCRADPAHFGDDIAAQDRAPVAAQCLHFGRERRAKRRVHAVRPRPQHHAAVPHPRSDRRADGAAVAWRLGVLHARLQCAEILRLDAGGAPELVHRRAHHASGDSHPRRRQQGDHRRASACASSAPPRLRCRRK